jgi:hypothetical protein
LALAFDTSWMDHRTAAGEFFDLGLKAQIAQRALLLKRVPDGRECIG